MPRFPTTIPTLFIIGGAEDRVGKASLLRQFVKLSGGRRSQIVLIPTASSFQQEVTDAYTEVFTRLGAGGIDVVNPATRAIVAPYRVDARRCISYHTIELHGPIPLEFRRAIGNRIYGCDDCQWVCPWNRFARPSVEPDFCVRHGLDAPGLIELFGWDELEFLRRTEGSAIRRIGHERWLRNIAVALGNGPHSAAAVTALRGRLAHPSALVREHVAWALAEQESKPVDASGE